MSALHDWARDWGLSPAAITDLQQRLGAFPGAPPAAGATTERGVQDRARLAASVAGGVLWRNNVGATYDDKGNFIRYGLANDSKRVNDETKSADLIGINPVVITLDMVGTTIGQFDSLECKTPGWTYSGTPREVAQMNWAAIVTSLGGRARFTNGSDL